jgi:tetratricopeptide (TPR) repeat protein
VLLAALLSAGRSARAADPRTESAREHSSQGDAYYKLEKYGNAIGEYEQAYLAKADPSFLYNIAQCHRLMGQNAEAIKFYRRFLRDAPTAPNRSVAEKHIKDLEDASTHLRSPVEPPPPAPLPSSGSFPPPPAPMSPSPSPPPASSPPAGSPAPATTLPLNAPRPTSSTSADLAPIGENGVPPSQTKSHPFYTRWWFWTAVGVVVVGGIVVAAAAKHDPSCPGGFTCN